MENYLQILLSITKSLENVTEESPPSAIIRENAEMLKDTLNFSIEDIYVFSARLNILIDNSLKELQIMQQRHEDKLKIIAIPQLETLEILGNLSGSKTKSIQLIQDYKTEVLEQFESSWSERIKKTQDKWFINRDGTIKKGIGWGEKDGFMQDIVTEKDLIVKQIRRDIERKLEIFLDDLRISVLNKDNLNEKLEILNPADKALFFERFNQFSDKLKNYYIPVFAVDIDNKIFGDLTVSDITKIKTVVLKKTRAKITNTFERFQKIINNCFELSITFYNYFLEKQIFYQQETPEQLEAEKQWIADQIEKIQEIKKSLNYILNFKILREGAINNRQRDQELADEWFNLEEKT